jgi:tetraacyldisaccharide 4'-kinase
VAILSRGYGRLTRDARALPIGGGDALAEEVGDEPLLIARRCPDAQVWVGADRAELAQRLGQGGKWPDLILLDDGFQHWRLHRDEDVVVVDGDVGFGNGQVIPRGPLREPPSELSRATVIWWRKGKNEPTVLLSQLRLVVRHHVELLMRHGLNAAGETAPLASWAGRRVLAFAGLARPDGFFSSLEQAGVQLVGTRRFPDHHLFTPAERSALIAEAQENQAVLVTTEKDSVRLPGEFDHWALRLEVELLEGEGALSQLLQGRDRT